MDRRLTTIVAADLVGYSRLMAADEEGVIARFKAARADLIDPAIREAGGRIVKTMGDGLLVECPSPVNAVRMALAIQHAMAARERGPEEDRLRFRIGVNLGDVIGDGDDILGDGVNVAARLEALAPPGGILISRAVREQLHGKIDANFTALGPQTLKNIPEPIEVWRVETGAAPPVQRGGGVFGTRRLVAAVPLIAVLAAAAALVWPTPDREQAERLTIAVLPFTTPAKETGDRWLGQGVAEDILIELARFREIGVIARDSSFRYAEQPDNIAALRDDLGADLVIQGGVRLEGENLRLSLQLIETGDGTVVWADRYDRPYADVLEVRADALKQITARLVKEAQDAGGALAATAAPADLRSYELVLRARLAFYDFTRDRNFEAENLVLQAIATSPDYAAAWNLLANIAFQFYIQPYDARRGSAEQLAAAREAAEKAVSLDPRSAQNLATLGTMRSWAGLFEGGLADLRRAIEINPNDVGVVRQYADALSRAGFQREALEAWAKGEALDPFNIPINYALIARSHILLEEFDTAFALTTKCLQKAPQILPCHLFHIMAATGVGDAEAVKASAKRVMELAPRFTVSGWLRIVRFGDDTEADRLSSYLLAAGLNP